MQIVVHAADGIDLTGQCRAYVEYRMFSAARRLDGDSTRVSVRLEETGPPARARYRCVATADLSARRRVRVSASATRLHAAVDRAAERLSGGAERRLAGGSGRVNGSRELAARVRPSGPGGAQGE